MSSSQTAFQNFKHQECTSGKSEGSKGSMVITLLAGSGCIGRGVYHDSATARIRFAIHVATGNPCSRSHFLGVNLRTPNPPPIALREFMPSVGHEARRRGLPGIQDWPRPPCRDATRLDLALPKHIKTSSIEAAVKARYSRKERSVLQVATHPVFPVPEPFL